MIKKYKDWLLENAQINKTSIDNTGGYIYSPIAEEDESNYMFFSNLERIQELAKMILSMDRAKIDSMLNNGHDWANDHVTTSKTNLDHVFGFLKGELSESKILEAVHKTIDLHRQFTMDPTWWSAWRLENEKEKELEIEKDSFSKTYQVKDKNGKVLFVFDYKRSKIFTNEMPDYFTLKDEVTPKELSKIKDKTEDIKNDLAGVEPKSKEKPAEGEEKNKEEE